MKEWCSDKLLDYLDLLSLGVLQVYSQKEALMLLNLRMMIESDSVASIILGKSPIVVYLFGHKYCMRFPMALC